MTFAVSFRFEVLTLLFTLFALTFFVPFPQGWSVSKARLRRTLLVVSMMLHSRVHAEDYTGSVDPRFSLGMHNYHILSPKKPARFMLNLGIVEKALAFNARQ